MAKSLNVVVGLVFNDDNKILSLLRSQGSDFEGYWEFPGGKVESGETKQQAVIRELAEEVGIDVRKIKRLGLIQHQYTAVTINLTVYKITDYYGRPWGREGNRVAWVTPRGLMRRRCLPTCQTIYNRWLCEQPQSALQLG